MNPGTTSSRLRHSREDGGAAVALEHRIRELEQLADSQSRELRIQFERIAQLQAEWDILRIRFIKSCMRRECRCQRPLDDSTYLVPKHACEAG